MWDQIQEAYEVLHGSVALQTFLPAWCNRYLLKFSTPVDRAQSSVVLQNKKP
jgi:hypothetical protein